MPRTLPTLIIVSGPPGSGKSTLAMRLSQHLGLPHCARDAIKQGQVWHGVTPDADPAHALQLACNQAFRETVALLLQHGVSHVCDAAFQHHVWQPFLDHWHPQARIKVIVCTVAETVRHQRLHHRLTNEPQRGHAHADATYLTNIAHHPPFQVLQTDHPTLVVATHTPTYNPPLAAIGAWAHDQCN